MKPTKSEPTLPKQIDLQSLAVKYRPKLLEDLVGQEHLVSQIRGMLRAGRMPHALLIGGQTGTGKTTTARMIARYLNCKNPDPKTHAPCGECVSCKYVEGHPDVVEINASETRGIDDIRSLIAASKNMPVMGEHRIYILDEAHQLTPQATQAFLKPLEEPPAHTLWIICTTNPEKLPDTIRGRCHQFEVRPIEPEALNRRLSRIAKLEGIDPKEVQGWADILKVITDISNGQMRDSIQMLESVIFALQNGKDVDAQSIIKRFLSTTEAELEQSAAQLLLSIIQGNLKGALKEIRGGGASPDRTRGLMHKLRWLLVYLSDNSVGLAKWTPVSAKIFSRLAKAEGIRINLSLVLGIQYLLLEVEAKFNSMPIDESVIFSSLVSNFISTHKKASG